MIRLPALSNYCLAAFLLPALLQGQEPSHPASSVHRIEVGGHRGARGNRPENTIAAFQYAIAAGVDTIEFDVHVTKDNAIVVSHDPVLHAPICKGTSSGGIIHNMTLAEVEEWDCGGSKNPEFPRQVTVPGERVPTLDQVLDLAPQSKVIFQIEIKSTEKRLTREEASAWIDHQTAFKVANSEQKEQFIRALMIPGPEMSPDPEVFARMVLDKVRAHHLEDRVVIFSIDYRVLRAMHRLDPVIKIQAPCEGGKTVMDVVHELNPKEVGAGLSPDLAQQIQAAHAVGVKIVAMAMSPADLDPFITAGIDEIYSDYPVDVMNYLKQKGYR